MMLSVTSSQQCVLNPWKGFHPDTTEALWVLKLNPDVLSWKKIVQAAQQLEVSKKGRVNIHKTQSAGKNRE
jgi:hypothetical protein